MCSTRTPRNSVAVIRAKWRRWHGDRPGDNAGRCRTTTIYKRYIGVSIGCPCATPAHRRHTGSCRGDCRERSDSSWHDRRSRTGFTDNALRSVQRNQLRHSPCCSRVDACAHRRVPDRPVRSGLCIRSSSSLQPVGARGASADEDFLCLGAPRIVVGSS